MKKIIFAFIGVAAACSLQAERLPLSQTLIELKPDYRPSWTTWEKQPWTVGEDSLTMRANTNKFTAIRSSQLMRMTDVYFPFYCASGRFRLTFEYRGGAETGVYCKTDLLPMLYYPLKELGGFSSQLSRAEDWTSFDQTFEMKTYELWEGGISFFLPKGDYSLEVRKFRLVELPPEVDKGKALVLGGREMKEIVLQTSEDEMVLRNERRAAMMIRYALVKAGYKYLPIREVGKIGERGEGTVLVGRAAEGLFTIAQLDQIRTKDGTGAYAVKNGQAGVTGNLPGGPQYGAFRFLNAIGIEYIATDLFSVEPRTLGSVTYVHTPAIPYRAAPALNGAHVDLLGLTRGTDLHGNIAVGSGDATCDPNWGIHWRLSHDSLGFVVPMTELQETHPEYFALQADGTRMSTKIAQLGHTQFCWSNPELRKLVTDRFIEIMRGNPAAKFFFFTPGDGAGRQCHCEGCSGSGNTTALVKLLNEVGRETGKVFPDKRIITYSYATTLEAPEVDYIDPHVKFTDSIYMPSHWPASHWFDHPGNARGMKSLEDWRKVAPDIGLMLYYQNCGDWNDLWPAFWGWVKTEKNFAEHGACYLDRTYSMKKAGSVSDPQICTEAAFYILPRIETDPTYDVEAGLKRWFAKCYGSSAKDMRAWFDLCNEQVVKRDWVQNTEIQRRGFTTVEFCDRGFELLYRAIDAANHDGDEVRARRIKGDLMKLDFAFIRDFSRGRGTLPENLYPKWAVHVAEFVNLIPELHVNPYQDIAAIFKNLFFYELETPLKSNWWDSDQFLRIRRDPVGELKGQFPAKQEKTENGWRIPADGMVGGEGGGRPVAWRVPNGEPKIPGRILRREITGNGLILAQLKLDEAPTGAVTLKILGNDNDKAGTAKMQIEINGQTVFSGPVSYPKDRWTEASYPIPAGVLKAGVNDIVMKNITPEDRPVAECGAAFQTPADPYWGWVYLSHFDFEF